MPGPAPKPTMLTVLAGNPGRRPLNQKEAELPPAKSTPPSRLGAKEQDVWQRYARDLIDSGLLRSIDVGAFARFCSLTVHSEALAAEDWTASFPGVSPEHRVRLLTNLSAAIRQLEGDLGLNPSTRSRIQLQGSDGAKDNKEKAAQASWRSLARIK